MGLFCADKILGLNFTFVLHIMTHDSKKSKISGNKQKKNIKKLFVIIGIAVVLVISIMAIKKITEVSYEIEELAGITDRKLKEAESRIEIVNGTNIPYQDFQNKKSELQAKGRDLKQLEFWERKALRIQQASDQAVHYILSESNEMIKLAENKDWVSARDEEGNILTLKSARGIKNKDNCEIPTEYFLGSNFDLDNPNENVRAYQLFKAIEQFRNVVLEELGTYKTSANQFIFKVPKDSSGLPEAYRTCNPQDTSVLGEVYRMLISPELVKDNYSDNQVPYPYYMFNKAPVVAAHAVLTSLTVDIKQAERIVAEHFFKKVNP